MIVKTSIFEISAVRPVQWPGDGLPEFAFVGRSNVGKSSLLNRLLNRKALARVSGTPGKTQQINFFQINEQFRFVDLPGYGYAQVSKTERAQFRNMMDTYLLARAPLLRVLHLVDIRHEPTKDDIAVHQWLQETGRPICVIATKQDKISKNQAQQSVARIRKVLQTPSKVLPVSAVKQTGIEDLWNVLEEDLGIGATVLAADPANARLGDEHAGENQ